MTALGKTLILVGLILIGAGLVVLAAGRIPWFGKLPGDILIRRRNVTVYAPIATSLLLSGVLSLLLWFFSRRP